MFNAILLHLIYVSFKNQRIVYTIYDLLQFTRSRSNNIKTFILHDNIRNTFSTFNSSSSGKIENYVLKIQQMKEQKHLALRDVFDVKETSDAIIIIIMIIKIIIISTFYFLRFFLKI